LYNKYKRKRKGDENVSGYKVNKMRSAPGYFKYGCELLSVDKKTFNEIYKEYQLIFTRHYKAKDSV
jgi:hypothetical protein